MRKRAVICDVGVDFTVRHEMTDTYCPFCLRELKRVIKTGHTFCPMPDTYRCDYEVTDSTTDQPLTRAERDQEAVRIELDNQQSGLYRLMQSIESMQGRREMVRLLRQHADILERDND